MMAAKKVKPKRDVFGHFKAFLPTLRIEDERLSIRSALDPRGFVQTFVKEDPWQEHLTFWNVYEILDEFIRPAIKDKGDGELRDLLKSREMDQLAGSIQKYLKSLPRRYRLYVRLPLVTLWGEAHIKITEHLSLITVDGEGLPDTAQFFEEVDGENWPVPPSVFLVAECKGYAARHSADSTAIASGISLMKQFFELCQHDELFWQGFFSEPRLPNQIAAFFEDVESGSKEDVSLPSAFQNYVNLLEVDSRKLVVQEEGQTILTGKFVRAKTDEERLRAFKSVLMTVKSRLNVLVTEEDAARVLTALEWSFDSLNTANETLAFLQACIGLEALLGDDTRKDTVTERLADRLAYLIGRVESERTSVRERFRDVYDARSTLVHGRKSRLGLSDKRFLSDVRQLLSEAVMTEIRNLYSTVRARSQAEAKKKE